MPSIMTYIRESDMPKYLAIYSEGKGTWTEFIHNALNPEMAGEVILIETNGRPVNDFRANGKTIKNPKHQSFFKDKKK